ncbi:CAF17-like 4Fe-4S cluster assembly/insertion protein YgfZ [Sphingomonas quercus]|uniref:Folate-binding protein n=1 Tax=Sphingomonas quercus TaxID=2842451 RepID=A0ABS6BLV6_9SPHN|nr:folate-binding protein [Sphingomonas quercus]MBU3078205.1 folate-binding protein [Sphingomonas quercus]
MNATTLRDRALIRLSGEDVRGFLQGLVTADMNAPLPAWGALLTPQGKVLFDFLLWAEGDDILVDCEADQADALVRRLTLYRLRRRIVIAREPALAVHWAPGGDAGVADPRLPGLGRRWLAPAEEGDAAAAWRTHRLALGVTEGAAELGQDRTLWLEANARELGGVSFTKGCYVGQENTARMHHRAKVSRRLVVLRTGEDPGEAANVHYPALGLAVARLRVEAILASAAILPEWLKDAIAADAEA